MDSLKGAEAGYSQHLREFVQLRDQVRAIVPTAGQSIDFKERILWMVTKEPILVQEDGSRQAASCGTSDKR